MKTSTLILALAIMSSVALAGCANNGGPPTPTSPATTSPVTSTPATTTPATMTPVGTTPVTSTPVTTPGTPSTPTNGTPDLAVPRVYVTSMPEKAANTTTPTVCWRVEGNGSSPHTAVHYGPASHPNGTFSDYPEAVYPDNGPATTSGNFSLPSTFCGTLKAVSATVFLRAHAIVDGESVLGPEEVIVAGSGNHTIDLVGAPEVFPAGLSYNFCWELPGVTATSQHTAIHYGQTSHPNGTFSDYPEAVYPNNGPATTSGSFALPGPFCGNVTMPASGTLYLRAHALVDGVGYLGPERTVAIAPRVVITGGLPESAAAGSVVPLCWRTEGSAGTSGHTAIHYGNESKLNATAVSEYPEALYPDNGPATTTGSFALPGPFCANLTMPQSGSVYFRPHVVYPAPGGQELGPEYVIRVA